MDLATLVVHSLINRKGRKLLVINNNTYSKVRFTYGGKVLWRCTKQYCPSKVYTLNIEDNIVTFAKLHHKHEHVLRNKRGVKRKYTNNLIQCSQLSVKKTEESNTEGIKPNIKLDFNQWPTIKKEREIFDDIETDQISLSDSAPENLNEIRFPYRVPNECKVEIVPGVWIFEQTLEFVRSNLMMDAVEMIRTLLWYLIGQENMKYMSFNGCEETGTIQLPPKIFMVIQFLVAENCRDDSQLSLRDFIKSIQDIFDGAARNSQ